MSEEEQPPLEELLDHLEVVIGRLSEASAPLERLVSDYQEAARLLAAAEARLDAATRRVLELGPDVRETTTPVAGRDRDLPDPPPSSPGRS
jgi:exodeoxyribonuclease VII small subunit